MASQHYLVGFFTTAVLILTAVIAVNIVVDPYDVWGTNRVGVYTRGGERTMKWRRVEEHANDVVLLGSSRMAHVDPALTPAVPMFNAAFSAAMPEEMLSFIRNRVGRERLLVIGLDFFMFNSAIYPWIANPLFDRPAAQILLDHTLSWRVLVESIRTLEAARRGEPVALKANGARNGVEKNDLQLSGAENDATRAYDFSIDWAGRNAFRNFVYDERRIDIVRTLKSELDRRGQPYTVMLMPENKDVVERVLKPTGAEEIRSRWRADMREIFPDIFDFSDTYSDRSNYYRFDAYHFTPAVGAEMISRILADRGLLRAH
jgi:hypothetical protein